MTVDISNSYCTQISQLRRKQIFFVYGSMRSGTTWLQLMLDSHPAVSCRGEGHFLDRFVPTLQDAINKHNAYLEWKNQTVFEETGGYPTFTIDGNVPVDVEIVEQALLTLSL